MQKQFADSVLESLDTAAVRERLARNRREAEVLRRLLRVAEFADEELAEQRRDAIHPVQREYPTPSMHRCLRWLACTTPESRLSE